MICGATGVMVLLACVGCSLARVLPPNSLARISGDALTAKDTHTDRDALTRIEAHTSRNTLNLTIARIRRMEPNLRLNELDRSLFPDVPDYVFKNVLDYSPEAQRQLLADHQDPEVTAGLFQGDMAGLTTEVLASTRVGLKWEVFPERKWTNATVPYSISHLYLPSEREFLERAVSTLNFMTCIQFTPWDGQAEDYLLLWPVQKPRGCWSFVGKKGGRQIVSLQAPDSLSKRCFISLGKPIHELLHALGLFHEQARADRDEHVTIKTENIIPQYIHNFYKQSEDNTTIPFAYDYDSVMHYGKYFFSSNRRKPTIVPKLPGATIGQRIMLSKLDCLKVNDLYGCLDDPADRKKYTNFCHYLGL